VQAVLNAWLTNFTNNSKTTAQ